MERLLRRSQPRASRHVSTTVRNSRRRVSDHQHPNCCVVRPCFCARRFDQRIKHQSYSFIAASRASGSKSKEISKLESGSAPAPFFASPACRFRAGLEGGVEVEVAAAAIEEGRRGTVVAVAAGFVRGGRNGFLTPAEYRGCGVLDGGALRVMPSARLDPPCVCDAGTAGIIEVAEARRWESCEFEAVGAAVGPPPLDHSAAAGGGRGAPGPTGNGTRSAVGGGVGAARTGVGEGGSSRFFWECLVIVAAGRGGEWCVPFCGPVEVELGTGGSSTSLMTPTSFIS